MKQRVWLIISVLLLLSISLISFNGEDDIKEVKEAASMKGLCWVAGDSIGVHNINQINEVGANWISQTPFGWMEGHDNPVVKGNFDRAWWGETDRGISHTTKLAQNAGVQTMLKPHIWLRRSGDKWRSDIAMKNQEEWDQWFKSYKNWIIHYAVLAEESNIESLCIGTELHQTIKHTDRWREIIAEIRKVYSGQVTYAANWYQEFEDVKFWDDLDYIGIQGYFPLSKKNKPSKKDLLKSWKNHKSDLARVSKKFKKKVVFTEIGYKNTADGAKEPWTWPQDIEYEVDISDETQKLCYEAMFESLWHEPWFDGLFVWKWFHSTYKHDDFDEYFASRDLRRKEWAKKKGRKIRKPIYFTPQRTEALETMKKWYLEDVID